MARKKNKKKRVSKKRRVSKKELVHKKESRGKKEEMGRGQVWSVDVLLAVVIFVSIILVFYVTMGARQNKGLKDLESEAESLKIELEKNHEIGFLQADVIDKTKFDAFVLNVSDNYEEIKNQLGIRGHFCIFFEDAEGNIIMIGQKTGIGSPNVTVGGTPCGVDIS
ncbi:MAG: hypothetical protein KKF46_03765 [Nanoarchaeota archaeon]|nr:hypothetical protein [Nanoarchaeota archaeon]MBU1321451.1 hypothetical protein [Nanoarchaeota archaeon]MBU1596907.1 hypothetical protein [Nanoarchaeota archaeon]MBU2441556.1 hypothetical protein [Nanoarchaeota archaeon]